MNSAFTLMPHSLFLPKRRPTSSASPKPLLPEKICLYLVTGTSGALAVVILTTAAMPVPSPAGNEPEMALLGPAVISMLSAAKAGTIN